MKSAVVSALLLLTTLLLSCTPRKDISEVLPGSWTLVSGAGNDTLHFKRTPYAEKMKGFRMEIQPDGEFIDALFVYQLDSLCKRVFYNQGKWVVNTEDSLLETTVPVNLSYTRSRILKVDETELILEGLQPD